MKKLIIALLLSGLVLPGLGHMYLGQRIKGGVMIALVNIFLLVALFLALRGIGELMHPGMISGGMTPEKLLETLPRNSMPGRVLLASFFCLWLYGIVDLILCGRMKNFNG
jgi:hypothetical protein